MYMMFMYVDDKVINGMGIRGEINELYEIAEENAKEQFRKNPHAEFRTKITKYI